MGFFEDLVIIFQIMKLFLPFIAAVACFDELNGLKRERWDLMWFNRDGNTIFNHRHTGGSRPKDQCEFLEHLNLSLINIKLTSWCWLEKYMRKNEQGLNKFASTNKNAKSNGCWINCPNISELVNAFMECVTVINNVFRWGAKIFWNFEKKSTIPYSLFKKNLDRFWP